MFITGICFLTNCWLTQPWPFAAVCIFFATLPSSFFILFSHSYIVVILGCNSDYTLLCWNIMWLTVDLKVQYVYGVWGLSYKYTHLHFWTPFLHTTLRPPWTPWTTCFLLMPTQSVRTCTCICHWVLQSLHVVSSMRKLLESWDYLVYITLATEALLWTCECVSVAMFSTTRRRVVCNEREEGSQYRSKVMEQPRMSPKIWFSSWCAYSSPPFSSLRHWILLWDIKCPCNKSPRLLQLVQVVFVTYNPNIPKKVVSWVLHKQRDTEVKCWVQDLYGGSEAEKWLENKQEWMDWSARDVRMHCRCWNPRSQ